MNQPEFSPQGSAPSAQKSRGQADYEADVARNPNYADGAPRKTWTQLNQFARETWEAPYQKRACSAPSDAKR